MHSAGQERDLLSGGLAGMVTVFFRPSRIFAAVETVLEREGALAESLTSGIFRKWHIEAWKRRFQTPLLNGKPLESVLVESNDFVEPLMSSDRVFVRAQPIRELLSYISWLEVFARERLDQFPPAQKIIFSRTPHYPYELVFHRVALRLGYDIFFLHGVLGDKFFALSTGTEPARPKWLAGTVGSLGRPSANDLLQSEQYHAIKIRNNRQSVGSAVIAVLGIFVWLLRPNGALATRSRHRLNYKNQIIFGRSTLIVRLLESILERRRIRKFLAKAEVSASQNGPYVLLPLHSQPERSTDPEGGEFSHQVRFVQRVRDLLDESGRESWKIVVREHPVQLSSRIPGLGEANFRSLDFYHGLLSVRDTLLAASAPKDMNELMRNSALVATINGDAALEAMNMGIPALTGRRQWFSECSGVEDCESAARPGIMDALLSLRPEVLQSEVAHFFSAQMILFGGDNAPANADVIDLHAAECIALGIMDRLNLLSALNR